MSKARNLTGGIAWHWHAWRSTQRWAPTVEAIETWLLKNAQPFTPQALSDPPRLVIVGASAGWMMPSNWLGQFAQIDTYDIDPLAATLFQWRHGKALKQKGIVLNCHTADALQILPQLLLAHPKDCIFFDNILGQLRFQHDADWQKTEKKLTQFSDQLKNRQWGSVHDRMSGPVSPAFVASASNIKKPDGLNDVQWLSQINAQSPWLDHLTENVFPKNTPKQAIAWAFTPQYAHWLEIGWVNP